jgi:uncharacterized protein (TIGR02757 family)
MTRAQRRLRKARSAKEKAEGARRDAIGQALAAVEQRCDRRARVGVDPIGLVRRYKEPLDLEIAGLIAACLAFGNVRALRAKIELAFDRLGPHLAQAADDEGQVLTRLGTWKHRVYRAEDLAGLVIGARRVQRDSGSLERRFEQELTRHQNLRSALAAFTDAIRSSGGLSAGNRRGAAHILPDPQKSSACKRLLLYLRWMVRPDDGVDLGLWKGVPPSVLLVPVDTHIYRLARNLGFTRRRTLTWLTAEDITAALRHFDPSDPARFDFSLCHMGMLQRCPSRRDPIRCEGCGVRAVCRHWVTRSG